ncbi:uncharacterized membrane protein YbjE (DUF340 family) [Anaerosolibacter carboniphilus]|uniref:Uncharacterized membrane protein YbjE (DUF340 family) n=1 Tax=Anaerosolibacter carboniphilus TaxID=1417629 RepID=A0A841KTL0_9FIRM|nr:lysine exporter LysO family protein [Anaerosolibacter carboniphilus]MBB6214262.1 uncharacterized membrane protein YbjE (DUF340 family) [Anaerosolibacter carboniphilus]
MTILPFSCLGIGIIVGLQEITNRFLKAIDFIINITLIVLMLTIGMNIGVNNSIMSKLNMIGINCFVIALFAIIFSVIFTLVVEKTILPLDKMKENLNAENMSLDNEVNVLEEEKKKMSPLVLIMPLSIVTGVILGYFAMPKDKVYLLGYILTISLVLLYTGVGINLGNNRKVFRYIRVLGARIIFLSLAIFLGSVAGGFIAGIVLNLPVEISVMSSSGMSYYSLTGAYMTKMYGIETGTYGFVVNVMREFFTVLTLPLLIKISKGSPIAGGAAGNMDTMLMPITKFVGPELGLVTLITGTILTFAVPFILPILYGIFQ